MTILDYYPTNDDSNRVTIGKPPPSAPGATIDEPTGTGTFGRKQDSTWERTVSTAGDTVTGQLILTPAQQTNPNDAVARSQTVLLATPSTMTAKLTLAPAQQTANNDAVTRGQAIGLFLSVASSATNAAIPVATDDTDAAGQGVPVRGLYILTGTTSVICMRMA